MTCSFGLLGFPGWKSKVLNMMACIPKDSHFSRDFWGPGTVQFGADAEDEKLAVGTSCCRSCCPSLLCDEGSKQCPL